MFDVLHPTAKGYAIWGEAMLPTLETLMAAD
jgi:lysophospholipase L1-like esterase